MRTPAFPSRPLAPAPFPPFRHFEGARLATIMQASVLCGSWGVSPKRVRYRRENREPLGPNDASCSWENTRGEEVVDGCAPDRLAAPRQVHGALSCAGLRSITPLEGYSVFFSYESSMCKTEIKHPRVPFSNASFRCGGAGEVRRASSLAANPLFSLPALSVVRLIRTGDGITDKQLAVCFQRT